MPIHEGENGCPGTCSKWSRDSTMYLRYMVESLDHLEQVEAIQNAPAPSNVTELRAYLGIINYYHRYLRNLSFVLAPLHDLPKKGIPWS